MKSFIPNRFIANIAGICRENLLAEKWLLAPNRRIGNQWVEQVARSGQPAVNMRVTTVRSLVMELSGSLSGKPISRRGSEILVSRVLNKLREQGPRYFTTLEPFPSLVGALTRSIEDLRLAGIEPRDLQEKGGREQKMGELADLLSGYMDGLARMGRVDYGGLLCALADDVKSESGGLREGVILLVPDDLELGGHERTLVDLLPVVVVEGLRPGVHPHPGDNGLTDVTRLAWMDKPLKAPPPVGDGSLEILGASGEVNEARMALRKCLSMGWPLDQVEILYTDRGTYLPLLFEMFTRHFPFESGDLDNLPATFSEGIPSRYSRPGRALGAWARWAMDGFPVQGLASMVREGLLKLDGENRQAARSAAADMLTQISTGTGPGAALTAVRAAIRTLKEQPGERFDEDGDELRGSRGDLVVPGSLAALLETLEGCTPLPDHPLPRVLEGAACFLETAVRTAGEFDEYAARALALDIGETIRNMEDLSHFPGGDPLQWVVSLVEDVRVAGSGPRPGRLHVAPLALGGHSGRPHTIVLGLDDSRFPGSDRQEPVLLDHERKTLSPLLRQAGEELKNRETALAALALRIRGDLTLICSLRDLVEDRDTFPSTSLVKAFRILSSPKADQEALLAHILPPGGFIDPASTACLDSAEWWTGKFTDSHRITDGRAALGRRFPGLRRGMIASDEKRRTVQSHYDGLTGPLPAALDILSELGPAVSANRLQTLGTCPLRYFFRYVLGIEGVEVEPPEPGKWLTSADRGSLLHELFHVYIDGLIREGAAPDYDRDRAGLEELLNSLLERHGRGLPPPTPHAWEYERAQMMESADIFLREEESFFRDHEPLYTEASLGLSPTDLPTGLDREEPVPLRLAPGRTVRARGRIDRIDRRRSDGAFVITDYKSGSNWRYTRRDPFNQGRVVQHLLYILMAEQCLAQTAGSAARVAAFRFLFPTAQTQGEGLVFKRETLEGGREILVHLCDIAAGGCFLPTDDPNDCNWCDYALVCGDTASQALRAAEKLKNDDPGLDPMRKLRGYE